MADHLTKPNAKRDFQIKPAFILGCVAALAIIAYGLGTWWFTSHFIPGTTIDGIDVSWMDANELAHKIEAETASYANHVTGKGVDLIITAQDIDLAIDGASYASAAIKQVNPYAWPLDALAPKSYNSDDTHITFNRDKLATVIEQTTASVNEAAVAPVNASATWSDDAGAFVVIDPIAGTMIDASATTETLADDVSDLATATVLDDGELVQPAIAADDANLAQAIARANDMAALTIPLYKDGAEIGTIGRGEIATWVSITPELTCAIDQYAIADWAANTLADKVASDDEVRIWAIDADATAEALTGAIESLSAEPLEVSMTVIDERPEESEGARERGRHIDVNLSTQYARLYDSDSRVLWRSYLVSGNTSTGHGTITGSFAIQSKEREKVLIGLDEDHDDEPDYRTPVHYWMPFSGGYGLHDADWRYYFGGSIYAWNGSHGCVNLPVDEAAELYSLVNVGDPIIVHW